MAGTDMNQWVYDRCRLLVSYPPFLLLHQETVEITVLKVQEVIGVREPVGQTIT